MLHTTLAIHYGSQRVVKKLSKFYTLKASSTEEAPPPEAPPSEHVEEEIHCEFTLTLNLDPPVASDQSDEGIVPDRPDDVISLGEISAAHELENIEANDPENVFPDLFMEDGCLKLELVQSKIRGKQLEEILTWTDVDHYNLLEKAVVYNNKSLVNILLECDREPEPGFFGFGNGRDKSERTFEESLHHFRGAIHLAAFLGCVDIVQEFLDHEVTLCALRGPVYIRPVAGPPSDLFSIIGYTKFPRNPRLSFQMQWLKDHPNERPVHYAICGGYPLIMQMLMAPELEADGLKLDEEAQDYMSSSRVEQDALLASLIRQAAACASYSCLSELLKQAPEALYMRDQRGWLCVMSGLPHGLQFIRFLMEQGFAVKLLNNIDGRNTVNALHVFYSGLSKSDGALSKYTEIYDVTEMLVDLGVDVNMETTAFRSHDVADTAVHILIDNLNLVVSAVSHEENGPRETRSFDDIQQVYDESLRDALYILLDGGFQVDKHGNSLLRRLFSNRNYLKRYKHSKLEQRLVQGNYGLRNMFNIGKLLLAAGGVMLSPGRRELSPSLCLVDTLRDDQAIECVLGDRRATLMFNSCLRTLFQNGDDPNAYPLSYKDDSYLPAPLIHVCDLYINYLCRTQDHKSIKTTLVNAMDVITMFNDANAHFTCFMNVHGQYLKHGVFDNFRKLFHTIQRQLNDPDQSTNALRMQIVTEMTSALVQRGAAPVLEEYIFRKSHLPLMNSQVETCILGQVMLLGAHCSLGSQIYSHGEQFIKTNEFKTCFNFFLNIADHDTYYNCLQNVLVLVADVDSFGIGAQETEFCRELSILAQSVRPLTYLCRLVIRQRTFLCLKRGYHSLPLPSKLLDFVVS